MKTKATTWRRTFGIESVVRVGLGWSRAPFIVGLKIFLKVHEVVYPAKILRGKKEKSSLKINPRQILLGSICQDPEGLDHKRDVWRSLEVQRRHRLGD